jgi:hypothetical protein
MSEQKATLEQVRKAYDDLVRVGQLPSSANVLKLTGGSKSTVVKFLRVVRAEKVAARPEPEVPLALLQAVGEPLIRQLWNAAEQLATKLYEARIADLTTMLNGMLEDLKGHEAAEDRILELEEQLKRRDDFDSHLRSLQLMVQEMGVGRAEPKGDRPKAPAMISVLGIIFAADPAPVDKREIDRQMVASGYKETSSQKARWHAVDGGYAEAMGEALLLTEAGKRKLRPAIAS